jgi:hypothetical protein
LIVTRTPIPPRGLEQGVSAYATPFILAGLL